MAKSYNLGDDYKLYYDTVASWANPTYAEIKACGDLAVDPGISDVEIPERGISTGHLQGKGDPSITFTLYEDTGDANVTALIAAIHSGAKVHLAVARGTGTNGWHMECCLVGAPFSATRGEPAGYEVEAKRHANSDYDFTRELAMIIP